MINHRSIAVLLLPALVLAGLHPAFAQPARPPRNYLVHVWQTDSGLPQNWVSSIAQTPDGYLWIGTRYGGLARFDGVRFMLFNQQNTPELKDVQVEHLTLDETGRLWIVMGNESVTALRDGEFELFRQPRQEPRLRLDRVLSVRSNQVLFTGEFPYLPRLDLATGTNGWEVLDPRDGLIPQPQSFTLDREDSVWFVTQDQRLGRLRQNQFELAQELIPIPGPRVSALAATAERQVWLATLRHILRWNGSRFEIQTPTNGPLTANIRRIAVSGDGGLWVLDNQRLRKFQDGRWVAEADPSRLDRLGPQENVQLYGDAQGGAWLIRYGRGLWHIKADGTTRGLTEKDGLPSVFITCWFQDSEENIWIGTAGGGIARIRESLFQAFGQDEGLPGKVVRSVCRDVDGTLWAGTLSAGLAQSRNGRFMRVPLPVGQGSPVESVTVTPDPSGGVWIGTLNRGLFRLQDEEVSRPPAPPDLSTSVRTLFTDRHGRVWVGGLVNLFRHENGQFRRFGNPEGFVDGHAIGAMAEDAAGSIWIGTGPGELWKCTEDRFTRFAPPADWPLVRIAALLADTNGTVWIGTLGNGLLRFRDGQFSRITMQHGLPDNNVSQLLDGGDGHLWAGTYSGIFRARKTDLDAVAAGPSDRVACRVYGRFDGLPALECSSGFQPSCWRADDGQLWFTTANGLVSVHPSEVVPNALPPTVVIEHILVDGRARALPKDGTALRIEPGRHYVQFRFTGLNFAAPDGVRFRVRLEGGEEQWQDTGNQRTIGYGPLLPGEYKFRVLACNNDGVWNETGDTLAFTVLPYFWETWWFRAGLGLATLVALALAVALTQRRRYRRRIEKVERQREMERERTRIARDLHDDLGTSLTQISLLSALANRAETPPAEAKELLHQVRGRAREMVTALDEIVWAVNPKNDSLAELVSYLGHFAEEFFRPTRIRCRLDFPTQLPAVPLSADARHHLFLAFKEALNNVARHSGATEVALRIKTGEDVMVIEVADNGHGFETGGGQRTGNGLINLHKRMELLGGRAAVVSQAGAGTTVTLHAPLPGR